MRSDDIEVWPGRPYPLGATYDGTGTNFSLFSEAAEGVELCLFDGEGVERRLGLPPAHGLLWHALLAPPGLRHRHRLRPHGPSPPPPIVRPSTSTTGTSSPIVPEQNISSAR